MKRIPLLIILAALLVSCASKPERRTVWTHPTFTQEQYNQDAAYCNFEVNKAMLNYRYSASTPWEAGIGRAQGNAYAKALFRDCMISKGWEAREIEIPRYKGQ